MNILQTLAGELIIHLENKHLWVSKSESRDDMFAHSLTLGLYIVQEWFV